MATAQRSRDPATTVASSQRPISEDVSWRCERSTVAAASLAHSRNEDMNAPPPSYSTTRSCTRPPRPQRRPATQPSTLCDALVPVGETQRQPRLSTAPTAIAARPSWDPSTDVFGDMSLPRPRATTPAAFRADQSLIGVSPRRMDMKQTTAQYAHNLKDASLGGYIVEPPIARPASVRQLPSLSLTTVMKEHLKPQLATKLDEKSNTTAAVRERPISSVLMRHLAHATPGEVPKLRGRKAVSLCTRGLRPSTTWTAS